MGPTSYPFKARLKIMKHHGSMELVSNIIIAQFEIKWDFTASPGGAVPCTEDAFAHARI
jgi:hypothetical protein